MAIIAIARMNPKTAGIRAPKTDWNIMLVLVDASKASLAAGLSVRIFNLFISKELASISPKLFAPVMEFKKYIINISDMFIKNAPITSPKLTTTAEVSRVTSFLGEPYCELPSIVLTPITKRPTTIRKLATAKVKLNPVCTIEDSIMNWGWLTLREKSKNNLDIEIIKLAAPWQMLETSITNHPSAPKNIPIT
jgi:hypothetical protein